VLTSGEDVAPERYGEEILHPNVECVPERDALEFQLLEWALADDLPVLAICRGVQVLNVGLGGLPIRTSPPTGPPPSSTTRASGTLPARAPSRTIR
jgi:putative glutamine amidotransferase